jgi:hypothetical protein
MIRQPKIIVRTEIEDVFSIHSQPGSLRRANRTDTVVQALFFQTIYFLFQPIKFGHGTPLVSVIASKLFLGERSNLRFIKLAICRDSFVTRRAAIRSSQ